MSESVFFLAGPWYNFDGLSAVWEISG